MDTLPGKNINKNNWLDGEMHLVRYMVEQGLSERRSLKVVSMSPSALRYRPAEDQNRDLKAKIITLTSPDFPDYVHPG